MTITAKYAGTCTACGRSITSGQKIEWSKGSKPRHTECAAVSMQAQKAPQWPRGDRIMVSSLPAGRRGGGRRTGCSCGSREDSSGELIPSSRNCKQCQFDAYDC